jgi:gamma-F420-2:alpha-L-glutamate ligase
MEKPVIGYIYSNKNFTKDEKIFSKLTKKYNYELVMFNLLDEFDESKVEEQAKKCNIIFNNSSETFALEFIKTLESLGKKVVDPSRSSYYIEDKWLFFLNCKKNKIPTPETILLSENVSLAKKELNSFDKWPVILKRVEGTCGEYVSMAKNLGEAEKIMNRFWKKGSEKLPIIAQEYIPSPCYRITTIGNEIVQTAIKKNKSWKSTGVYAKKIGWFKVTPELKLIVDKIMKSTKIKVCGIDLLKKDNEWFVLEINSDPAFDFFKSDREKLISKVVQFLIKEVRGNSI